MNTPPRSVVLTTTAMVVFTGTALLAAYHKTSLLWTVVLGAVALLSQLATGMALYRWVRPHRRVP